MKQCLWISQSEGKRFEALQESIDTDILIIGGGLVGINTSLLLSQEGREVTLIDSNYIGYGTSGRNTGKLTPQTGLIYAKIKRMYGLSQAIEFYKSNQEALDFIRQNINRYQIACDFEEIPSYVFSEQIDMIQDFEEEYKIYKELGIEGELVNRLELPLDIKVAISQSVAAAYNPKRYIDGLIPQLLQNGVKIYEESPVTHIEKTASAWEATIKGKFKIKADRIVLASHYPFYDNMSFYVTRLRPEASYIIAGECTQDFPHATFINEDQPKRSLRPYRDGGKKMLLIGGDNHKVGQSTMDHYEELKSYGKAKFGITEYCYEWGAQGYMTPDNIPYIGYLNEHSDKVYVATGFNKWGNLNSIIGAKRITELILDQRDDDNSIYDPSRAKGYFTSAYIKDNFNTAYEWIKSKIEPVGNKLPDQNDTATIVKIDDNKYGAYKDIKGKIHIVDITCPHMGAELNWNPVEKTWDCPCHGSRFTYDGAVIEGPATYRLKPYGEGKNNVDPEIFES